MFETEGKVFNLTGIFQEDGVTVKQEAQYRVGREVISADNWPFKEGLPMRLCKRDDLEHCFQTSRIRRVESLSSTKVRVHTQNTVYELTVVAA